MSNQSGQNEPKKTVWRASPTKWMLFKHISIFLIMSMLGIIALFTYLNKPVNADFEQLIYIQKFIASFGNIRIGLSVSLLILMAKLLKLRFENYELTEDRLCFNVGILTRSYDETMLFRIVDTTVELPILLRILGRGHIIVYSNDPSEESSGVKSSFATPDGRKGVYLSGIKSPKKIKKVIDSLVEKERRKFGIRASEFM
jgi:hypothetical protein